MGIRYARRLYTVFAVTPVVRAGCDAVTVRHGSYARMGTVSRIVSGKAGGTKLRVPKKGTRPTTEIVREALFNILEVDGDLDGARVLDLYSGSGGLGLEALSRGAASVLFVEADRAAADVLRGNIANVGLGGTVRQRSVLDVLRAGTSEPVDLVLTDPPYALDETELADNLAALVTGGWLHDGSLVIVERYRRSGPPRWPEQFVTLRDRRYGENVLHRAEFRPGEPDES